MQLVPQLANQSKTIRCHSRSGGAQAPLFFPLSSKDKKAMPVPESKGKVPYRFVICKVKGCVRMHDNFYPMCTKHRRALEIEEAEDGI